MKEENKEKKLEDIQAELLKAWKVKKENIKFVDKDSEYKPPKKPEKKEKK